MNRGMIQKTEEFLKAKLQESTYFTENPAAGEYRLQHSYRVANIGKEIAEKEGFDVTEMVIAGLLHDVSYCVDFKEETDWLNHGRNAAKIARPFLEELGLKKERIDDICYSIAIHVDDKADFEGERTPFAETIGDADNIDRFDVYRIYETLEKNKFRELSYEEKTEKVATTLERLHKYEEMKLGTKTAEEIWKQRIAYYISFYEKLQSQLKNSTEII